MAGDVCVPLNESLKWLSERLSGSRIIYCPGNHDFWRPTKDDRFSYQDMVEHGRDLAEIYGIDLIVEDESVEIAGTRFVGGTLWTSMTLRPPYVNFAGATSEARKRMNDFHRVRYGGNRSKDRLTPEDTVYLHRQTRQRIDAVLAEPFAGPSVVVTHHAPHPSCLPGGDGFDLAWCYASDMSGLIEERRPDLWIHGHVHGRRDLDVGGTRIVLNARGHVRGEDFHLQFDPGLVVEVEALEYAQGAAP